MQINPNRPSFKARVHDVEPLIAKHFADSPKTAQTLREEAQKLKNVGPDETTTHKIICDEYKPANIGVESTITAPAYLKSIQSQLLPEQIAKAAHERYTRYLKANATAASITTT